MNQGADHGIADVLKLRLRRTQMERTTRIRLMPRSPKGRRVGMQEDSNSCSCQAFLFSEYPATALSSAIRANSMRSAEFHNLCSAASCMAKCRSIACSSFD